MRWNAESFRLPCFLIIADLMKHGRMDKSKAKAVRAMLVAGILFASGHLHSSEVVIVKNGRAEAAVITAADPSPMATYAAQELISHVARSSGVVLPLFSENDSFQQYPVRVFVGKTTAAAARGLTTDKLDPDAYIMLAEDTSIYILGQEHMKADPLSERAPFWGRHYSGTLFGVYEFLEQAVEVRWMWPGELGTFIPKKETIVQPHMNKVEVPALKYRMVRWGRIRNLLNNYTEDGDPLAFSAEGFASYANDLRIYLRRHRMGWSIPQPVVGHYFEDWWNRYGKEHPEWFMIDDKGRRGTEGGADPLGVAMCVSNPELHKFIVDEAWNGSNILRLGEVDSIAYCHCPNCLAWDAPQSEKIPHYGLYITSDRYARFWKAIYDLAVKRNPNVILTVYLYFTYFPAPITDILLNKNIHAEFVPWGNPEHTDFFPMSQASYEWLKDQWLGWKKTGITMVYRPNYLHDGYVMPHVNIQQAGDFFKFAFANGMEGADMDSLTGQWAVHGPKLYMHMRLLAKPELAIENILNEYYGSFGPAAEQVRYYFDYWENYAIENMLHINGLFASNLKIPRWSRFLLRAHEAFPPESYEPAFEILKRAGAAVQDLPDQQFARRVEFLRLGLEHARITGRLAACFEGKYNIPEGSEKFPRAVSALQELALFRRKFEGMYISDYLSKREMEKRFWNLASLSAAPERKYAVVKYFELPAKGWKFKRDKAETGIVQEWFAVNHDDNEWESMEIGKAWQEFGHDYVGAAWYRGSFFMPAESQNDAVEINFGGVDESAWVWINGEYAGEHDIGPEGWNVPFSLDISKIIKWGQINHLAIKARNTRLAGGIWQPVYINILKAK